MSFEVLFCFLFGFFLRFVFFLKILTLDVDAGFIKGFSMSIVAQSISRTF